MLESLAQGGTPAYHWSADVWPRQDFQSNFRAWQQGRQAHQPPLGPPAQMAPLPAGVNAGGCVFVKRTERTWPILGLPPQMAPLQADVGEVAAWRGGGRGGVDAQALFEARRTTDGPPTSRRG